MSQCLENRVLTSICIPNSAPFDDTAAYQAKVAPQAMSLGAKDHFLGKPEWI
jgi:hypothetical protein